MSKTAVLDALHTFDLDKLRKTLQAKPALKSFRDEKGFSLLQICCQRVTDGSKTAADRQLRMAKWLVGEGFDPLETYVTKPGEDGEEDAAELSLVFFAVARAQSNALARYFMERGAKPGAFFAAAWWGNGDILEDMVRHGADINEVVDATPLHMAVDVVQRGIEGNPERARRRLKCLKEFLRLGADPNIPASDGTTPLHTALKKDYFDAFEMLVQHGANPDVPGKDGRTVREIASKKRDKRYFKAL
jgi:hypothetical protein